MEEEPAIPRRRLRARGALSNRSGRFDLARLPDPEALNAALAERGAEGGVPAGPRTEIREERVRRLITRNASPDIPFDRSINPYRGCEHGCIYCYARPGHAWLGLSPGLDFETRLIARPNAAQRLRRELSARGYRAAPLALGTHTDPYQPAEGRYRITRACLAVLAEFGHPAAIVTRGTLVERDLDILAPMARRGLMRVGITITTLDADLARRMEPRAPPPARRLEIVRRLSAAGVPVRVMVAPVVPGLTDHEIEAILRAAAGAGAVAAGWAVLRLPRELAELWREWLAEHEPGRARRVMARLREIHGGRDYDPRWWRRMRGQGPHAEMIARRFALAMRRHGLDTPLPSLRRDLFRVPPRPERQLSLF